MGKIEDEVSGVKNEMGSLGKHMQMLETQMGQMATTLSSQRQQGQLPNPKNREHCNAITLRSGCSYEVPEVLGAAADEEGEEEQSEFAQAENSQKATAFGRKAIAPDSEAQAEIGGEKAIVSPSGEKATARCR